ncbi:hypothetical protein F5146DRAFT_200143 [Armillaria mellea]|nr:hypothetical protein F5146DRAFT_200143 [Armillaria mellea]
MTDVFARLVPFFYPMDFTFIHPIDRFSHLRVVDSQYSYFAWANQLRKESGLSLHLKLPLMADLKMSTSPSWLVVPIRTRRLNSHAPDLVT